MGNYWQFVISESVTHFNTNFSPSRPFNDISTAMLFDENTFDSSGSNDNDFYLLLIECMSTKLDIWRMNLEDLKDAQCETMFRHVLHQCVILFSTLKTHFQRFLVVFFVLLNKTIKPFAICSYSKFDLFIIRPKCLAGNSYNSTLFVTVPFTLANKRKRYLLCFVNRT